MPDAPEKGFEVILKELNEVVDKLEKGNLPLDDSIALYTQGVNMLQSAREVLDRAQSRLDVLMSPGDAGEPVVQELEPSEFLEEVE